MLTPFYVVVSGIHAFEDPLGRFSVAAGESVAISKTAADATAPFVYN